MLYYHRLSYIILYHPMLSLGSDPIRFSTGDPTSFSFGDPILCF